MGGRGINDNGIYSVLVQVFLTKKFFYNIVYFQMKKDNWNLMYLNMEYDRERDSTLFPFWNFNLLELIFLFYILVILSWFEIKFETKVLFWFYQSYDTIKSQRKEKKKHDLKNFYHLHIFENLGHLEKDPRINVRKCTWTVIYTFTVPLIFLLKSRHTMIGLKSDIATLSQEIYWHVSIAA